MVDSVRKGLFFPGSLDLPGYPTLGVSEDEVVIANTDSYSKWVGLEDWDIPDSNDGFMDRVTDELYLTVGNDDVESSFEEITDGTSAYLSSSTDDAISCGDFDTSGSFTVAWCGTEGVAFGSEEYTEDGDAWYVVNGTGDYVLGLQCVLGGVSTSSTTNYSGPMLDEDSLNVLILEVDRVNSEIRFHVNGESYTASTNTNIASETTLSNLQFGAVKASGNSGVWRANTHVVAAAAFEGILSDDDFTALQSAFLTRAGRE